MVVILKRDHKSGRAGEECALATFGADAQLQEVSRQEHRVEWQRDGFSGYVADITLRSGIELVVSESHSLGFLTVPMGGTPTPLSFVFSRGTGVRVVVDGKQSFLSGAGRLEVSQVKRPVEMKSTMTPGAHNEFVVLNVSPGLISELLDTKTLPRLIQEVVDSGEAFARATVPMPPALFRLLDELLHTAATGLTRMLYLEGKALEILARVFDAFQTECCAKVDVLPAKDVARLHEVRKRLIANLNAAPSIDELSRHAGLNQTKLKADFRTLFGLPVYTYLRERRMTEAHRLLGEGSLNVTEVASTVGYANASKFSSAFRRHFGLAPSEIRSARY